jgi:hypothetical protein
VLLWLIAIVATFTVAIFNLFDYGSIVLGLGAAIACIALTAGGMAIVTRAEDTAMHQCMGAGRAWAVVGQHTEWSAATKTTHTVTDYGCVDRR